MTENGLIYYKKYTYVYNINIKIVNEYIYELFINL